MVASLVDIAQPYLQRKMMFLTTREGTVGKTDRLHACTPVYPQLHSGKRPWAVDDSAVRGPMATNQRDIRPMAMESILAA